MYIVLAQLHLHLRRLSAMEKYTRSKRGLAAATKCSGSKSKSKVEHASTAPSEAEGSQKSRNSNDTGVGTYSIDLRVLECLGCFGPLLPPIYQCENGHVACHPCYEKLRYMCHTCESLLSYARNLALENVLESVMISCPHASFGCEETVAYIKQQEHLEKCTYAPSSCLFPDCNYAASFEELIIHGTKSITSQPVRSSTGSPSMSSWISNLYFLFIMKLIPAFSCVIVVR